MGASPRMQKVLAGCAVVAVVAAAYGLPGRSNAVSPLQYDHTRTWSFVRVPHRPATANERFYGEVASVVARRPVEVRCEDFSIGSPAEPGGVVQFNGAEPADYARIRPDECTALLRFRRDPTRTMTAEAADALTVLAHESEHLAGVKNEAAAECFAIQDLPRVVRAFGGTSDQGAAMATFEYDDILPKLPPAYRSPECRPGGKLDGHASAHLAAPPN